METNNAGVVRYYYDKKSQMLLSKVFPNGNKNMYSYDNNFRLKTIQSYDSMIAPSEASSMTGIRTARSTAKNLVMLAES